MVDAPAVLVLHAVICCGVSLSFLLLSAEQPPLTSAQSSPHCLGVIRPIDFPFLGHIILSSELCTFAKIWK